MRMAHHNSTSNHVWNDHNNTNNGNDSTPLINHADIVLDQIQKYSKYSLEEIDQRMDSRAMVAWWTLLPQYNNETRSRQSSRLFKQPVPLELELIFTTSFRIFTT